MKLKRVVAALQILLFSLAVWGYLWWGRFEYHHRLLLALVYVVAALLVVSGHRYFRDSLRILGLRLDNLGPSLQSFGFVTLMGASIIIPLGILWGEARFDKWEEFLVYPLSALLQQYLLQNFLRLRAEDLLNVSHSPGESPEYRLNLRFAGYPNLGLIPSLLAAGLFSLYHLPNYPLMGLSLIGGLAWCLVYRRRPNLLAAWMSQAVLSVLMLVFFKFSHLDQFEVGLDASRYEAYGDGVQVAAGYDASGRARIVTTPGPDSGTASLIRVFDHEGTRLSEWVAFSEFDFSAHIAVGELGFGAGEEVVVAPGPGPPNPPLIRIFNLQGTQLSEFSLDFLEDGYGAWVSVGCGRIYVCPGPGPNRSQAVFELSPNGQQMRNWSFSELGLENGLRASPICSGRSLRGSAAGELQDLVLWASPVVSNAGKVFFFDSVSEDLFERERTTDAYGVNVTLLQLGLGEIGHAAVLGYLKGYPPLIEVFSYEGKSVSKFSAAGGPEVCGGNLAAVDTDRDGADEIVLGEGICPGQPSTVRILSIDGQLLHSWEAYDD
jgi:hypothetical protein